MNKFKLKTIRKLFLFVCVMQVCVFTVLAQSGIRITGTVSDDAGGTLPGVNVVVKGSMQGTVTDLNGAYSITVPDENAMLVFSSMGYASQEILVGVQRVINVTLSEDARELEEVVVIGYGAIKKVDLTGAVSVVDPGKAMGSAPMTDLARGLQGVSPGLTVISNTGNLGVAPQIYIRSIVGSINTNAEPLILLDGVEIPDLQIVNPKDIESISILKDASSTAIYGTRGSFGVVLLSTKKGTKDGKFRVNYDNSFAWTKPINIPKLLDDEKFIDYYFTASNRTTNANTVELLVLGVRYDLESIEKIKKWKQDYGKGEGLGDEMVEGRDYEYRGPSKQFFPYRPWDLNKILLNDASPMQQHNLSVSGSTGKMNLRGSIGFADQTGFHKATPKPDSYKRFTTLVHVDGQVNNWFKPFFTAQISNEVTIYPQFRLETLGTPNGFWYHLYRWPESYPSGYHNGIPLRNTRTELEQAHMNSNNRFFGQMQVGANFTPVEGLNIETKYAYWATNRLQRIANTPAAGINQQATQTSLNDYRTSLFGEELFVRRQFDWTDRHNGSATATYNFKLRNDHNFTLMAGGEFNLSESEEFRVQKATPDFPDQPEINLSSGAITSDKSSHSHWSALRFFGRVNYSYANRYILQVSGCADGGSNFPPGKKWGYFPSVSAGWVVSNENFWSGATLRDVVPYLKMRLSYGSTGNNRFPPNSYYYLSMMNASGSNWWIGGANQQSFGAPTMVSTSLTWETVKTYDLGFEAKFFKNALDVEFNLFRRITDDMIVPGEMVPNSLGTSPPRMNAATMQTDGWEIALTYNKAFNNGFSFSIMGTLSDGVSKITKHPKTYGLINNGGGLVGTYDSDRNNLSYYEGQTIGDIWGLETDRLFTENDFTGNSETAINKEWYYAAGVPNQNATIAPGVTNFKFAPGDVKYKDTNGDGVVNFGDQTKDNPGSTDNPGDLRVIGNNNPRYTYGVTLRAAYKGFDARMFFQGVGKRHEWRVGANIIPNWTWGEALFANQSDYWTPDNPNAFYPGPSRVTVNSNSGNWVCQTRYMLNMSYLRFKTLEIGYTIPAQWLSKVKIENLRIFFSGVNLFTWDKLDGVMMDPEMQIDYDRGINNNRNFGLAYPYSRTISCGLSLSF